MVNNFFPKIVTIIR